MTWIIPLGTRLRAQNSRQIETHRSVLWAESRPSPRQASTILTRRIARFRETDDLYHLDTKKTAALAKATVLLRPIRRKFSFCAAASPSARRLQQSTSNPPPAAELR